MAVSKIRRAKKVQKTVYFDDDVWEALEKQMKVRPERKCFGYCE